jgi:hypothetical protein
LTSESASDTLVLDTACGAIATRPTATNLRKLTNGLQRTDLHHSRL